MAVMAHQQTAAEQRSASRTRMRRELNEKILPRLLIGLVCLIFLLPFYWMIVVALKSNEELTRFPPTLYPHNPQWQNFWDSTKAFPFWQFARNTGIITAFTVLEP